jgi:hypothetical protein
MIEKSRVKKALASRMWWARLFSTLLILAMLGANLASPGSRARADTNTLTLNVISARTEPLSGVSAGDPITDYKYIINIDNTGTTTQRTDPSTGALPVECTPEYTGTPGDPLDPGYPDSCDWVSIAGAATNSPIYTQGDQSDFASGGLDLPDGRYLISVLADGFKLDGVHFTVPLPDPNPQTGANVTVLLQPTPLPTATIQAAVFEDISITNGAPDVPAEHGLAGFQGHIADYLGEVTTDVFGDPLCGNGICLSQCYVVDNGVDLGTVDPIDAAGRCPVVTDNNPGFADGLTVEGKLIIPNLGPNRYALSIIPPDGSGWIQTTTLEGNHDWDAWVMEGATGLDTEFVVAGEPFPAIIFGYVQPTDPLPAGPSGHIKGVVAAVKVYVPANGGVTGEPGITGGRIDKPIEYPWIALNDLTNGDTAIYIRQGNADGSFDIANVPNGNYTLTWWDEPQDYILAVQNVTVANGETVDLGVLSALGWWTQFDGYVFNDANRNGIMDWVDADGDNCPDPGEGELGMSNFTLTMRKRENSLMDRGATVITTDACGHYYMENAYPMTQWLVMEAYNDLFYTTGVTYQADNQLEPTTVLGAGVDVSVLPIIGLSGRLDWGVHAYDPTGTNGIDPRNGGIVGTVSYDTTRNELDPRYAAVEDWQPGVPDLVVDLYAPVYCGTTGAPCSDDPISYELNPDGSYARGQLLNTYVTETWLRPGADQNANGDGSCVPRDVNGDPLLYPDDQQVTNSASDCLEGPLMGIQFQQGYSAVDGNYGFGDGCFNGTLDATDPANPVCVGGDFTPLPGGLDYLVSVEIPDDALGRPLYKVTREEDINIGNGDEFIPQVPPPACAGPLHTVDVATLGTDGYPEVDLFGDGSVIVPASTPTENATFVDIGGSPYEGLPKPLCDTKLVPLNNGKSIVPTFNLFTDVPLPGRFWGLVVDDLNFSSDPQSLLYGEKAGVPFAPVGIYDYTNRLVATAESDFNGLFDVLLPSTNRISCPTPSGVCANLYRFVGNDPGIPGQLNPNYRPEYRTIAAEFEALPGLIVPADLAPTQVGVSIQIPGGQVNQVSCRLDDVTPQLFAVSQPYVTDSGSFTIAGLGFGALQGSGAVTLDDSIVLPVTGWSDTSIAVDVPSDTPSGPHQLKITADNGQSTVNGLTFHVLRSGNSAFPQNGVLDNFNRSNSSNLGLNWGTPSTGYRINSNTLQVRTGAGAPGGPGELPWVATTFGANQEAYFTFGTISTSAGDQGLVLKLSSSNTYIRVLYNRGASQVRVISSDPTNGPVQHAMLTGVSFAPGDTFGASTLQDGSVNVYKNGVLIGSTNLTGGPTPWPTALAQGGGQIGLRFAGTTNTNFTRVDNFGGGDIAGDPGYMPNLYEVGPGYPYATIQSAIDTAASSAGDDLVVVYPGQPDFSNPRLNPRGAYYENLIVTTPIKLQGVGPGGFQGSTFVPGSIIDGSAFGGDTALADAWRTQVDGLTWDGNQNVNEGQVIYILTHDGTFTAGFKASIDGFDIRGGDQQGFPNNINQIGGGQNGQPPAVVTQGGAIFANAFARYLQITNNTVQNNGGSYGTIRIGTPDLPAPDTNNHNEDLLIAHNRIMLNAGTNLAGGIGLFAGADNYQVAYNDLCGNFSAEYGGGLSVYGYSPNGSIHDNRVYFNRAYDEGGGLIIAGQLPADPSTLSPGSGPVDIYNNLIQANLANDDGGGLRFLMAGNFPMNVYNNMIVNNVSTHEGGGIGLNDAPDVRVFNNTIIGNLTTATAVTSSGFPAPAGLSTSQNSNQLQATLPGGSPIFSNPLLFNNIFWDNRAGTRGLTTVAGIGLAGPGDIDYWDLGVADGTGVLSPTNSVVQQNAATHPYTTDPSNATSDPSVVSVFDISVAFNSWRTNPNFIGAILVALDLPPNLLGDYHLQAGSPATDLGALIKNSVNAPAFDIDNQARPQGLGVDSGADELPDGGGGGPPPTAFPQTGLLDDFNRPNSALLGASWGTPTTGYRVNTNTLQVRTGAGLLPWTVAYGANQEAYFTFGAVSTNANEQGLALKLNGSANMIRVIYNRASGQVRIITLDSTNGPVQRAVFTGVSLASGDQFGARAQDDGTVSVYKNGALIGSTDVTSGPTPWPTALAQGGGQIGLWFNGTTNTDFTRVDDFSGGTMP